MKFTSMLIAAFGLFVASSAYADAENLLPAGDFEKWENYGRKDQKALALTDNQVPAGWRVGGGSGALTRDTEVKHSGESSVRITNGNNPIAIEMLFEPFTVKGNTKYKVSYWVKGDKLAFAEPKFGWGGIFTAPRKDLWEKKKGPLVWIKKSGDFDWTEYSAVHTTAADDDAAMIRFMIYSGTGTLWLDDVRIEEVK